MDDGSARSGGGTSCLAAEGGEKPPGERGWGGGSVKRGKSDQVRGWKSSCWRRATTDHRDGHFPGRKKGRRRAQRTGEPPHLLRAAPKHKHHGQTGLMASQQVHSLVRTLSQVETGFGHSIPGSLSFDLVGMYPANSIHLSARQRTVAHLSACPCERDRTVDAAICCRG